MTTTTAKAQHTPGPWEVDEEGWSARHQPFGIFTPNGCTIAMVESPYEWTPEFGSRADYLPEARANAYLLAAAPDLLEACACAVNAIENACIARAPRANGGNGIATPEEQIVLEILRAAIARAEGGA